MKSRQCIGIVVGWDPPLETYYVQIIAPSRNDDEKDKIVAWHGTRQREFSIIADLRGAFAPYTFLNTMLTDELAGQLEADKASCFKQFTCRASTASTRNIQHGCQLLQLNSDQFRWSLRPTAVGYRVQFI